MIADLTPGSRHPLSSWRGGRGVRWAAWAPILLFSALAATLLSADVAIPPAPKNYFNDYASLVSSDDASRLNDKLRDFEQSSSNQIVVAIYPELPEPSLEDFTVRTAQAWRVGQKKLDN